LGFFVTFGIVRAASGEITIESKPGEGTRVHLDLPLARHGPRARMLSAPEAPPAAARAAATPTVLIVDDDEFVARGMKRLLRAYDVVCVPTVDDALGVLEASSDFDAVVCDLTMPLATGVDLYAHAQARWPELAARFLFVTGGATTGETAVFLAEHQDRVVYKPVDGKLLRRRVAEVSGGPPPTAR
jgi:CheY-like chemotaxis protein